MKLNSTTAIVTVIATLTITTAAYAQFKTISDDGIAASPKVRQMLNERKASAPVATPAMACDKCADVLTAKLSPQAKGAEVMTATRQVSFSHSCTGCETKLALAGEGKAKHQVAMHKCSLDVASTSGCCSSK
jgi:hypothetical protein